MAISKIKLGLINQDGTVQLRKIHGVTVARYKEAMRQGAIFPPLFVDKKTKILVSGYTRFTAYMGVFDVNYEVPVILKDYKDHKEMLLDAAADNSRNGLPMQSFETKSFILRCQEEKISTADGAKALCVSEDKYLALGLEFVIVEKPGGITEKKPLKGGMKHMKGEKMSESQYEKVEESYSGWTPIFHVNQIMVHIRNDTMDWNNEQNIESLLELADLIMTEIKHRGLST